MDETRLMAQDKWDLLNSYIHTVILQKLPKCDRDTIGRALATAVWKVDDLLDDAEFASDSVVKCKILKEADKMSRKVVRRVRTCFVMGLVTSQQYEQITLQRDEAGRLIGAMIKRLSQARV